MGQREPKGPGWNFQNSQQRSLVRRVPPCLRLCQIEVIADAGDLTRVHHRVHFRSTTGSNTGLTGVHHWVSTKVHHRSHYGPPQGPPQVSLGSTTGHLYHDSNTTIEFHYLRKYHLFGSNSTKHYHVIAALPVDWC